MALARAIVSCALVGLAAAQDVTLMLQTSASQSDTSISESFFASDVSMEGFGLMPKDAPDWCKNETELTWTQRKERMQGQATLAWAKIQYKNLTAENLSAPEWMEKMVLDDENRGKMKWAAMETKRLKELGQAVPQWMAQLAVENEKWACRWAACKVAALTSAGEQDVPQWLLDNAHKGIMEYAETRAAEIEMEIQELEQEEQLETALVNAHGDVEIANSRMLARTKSKAISAEQQTRIIEEALLKIEALEHVADADESGEPKALRKLGRAIEKAREELVTMSGILTYTLERNLQRN